MALTQDQITEYLLQTVDKKLKGKVLTSVNTLSIAEPGSFLSVHSDQIWNGTVLTTGITNEMVNLKSDIISDGYANDYYERVIDANYKHVAVLVQPNLGTGTPPHSFDFFDRTLDRVTQIIPDAFASD